MSRRKGRILAFQGLYSFDVGGVPLEDILNFSWTEKDENFHSEEEPEKSSDEIEAQTFARFIISGTIEHMDEIDLKIKNYLNPAWTLERINKVALAILRTSVYELIYQNNVEKNIVIDEAVTIAKQYGEDGSYKFINAILDKIAG